MKLLLFVCGEISEKGFLFPGGRSYMPWPASRWRATSSSPSISTTLSMACTQPWPPSPSAMPHLQVGYLENTFSIGGSYEFSTYIRFYRLHLLVWCHNEEMLKNLSWLILVVSFLASLSKFLLCVSSTPSTSCPQPTSFVPPLTPSLPNTSPSPIPLSCSPGCQVEVFPCERKTLETVKELQGNFMCWKGSKGYSPYTSLCPFYRQVYRNARVMKIFLLSSSTVFMRWANPSP